MPTRLWPLWAVLLLCCVPPTSLAGQPRVYVSSSGLAAQRPVAGLAGSGLHVSSAASPPQQTSLRWPQRRLDPEDEVEPSRGCAHGDVPEHAAATECPTLSLTASASATVTPSSTSSSTPSSTSTSTSSLTATGTATISETSSISVTPTISVTPSISETSSISVTPAPSLSTTSTTSSSPAPVEVEVNAPRPSVPAPEPGVSPTPPPVTVDAGFYQSVPAFSVGEDVSIQPSATPPPPAVLFTVVRIQEADADGNPLPGRAAVSFPDLSWAVAHTSVGTPPVPAVEVVGSAVYTVGSTRSGDCPGFTAAFETRVMLLGTAGTSLLVSGTRETLQPGQFRVSGTFQWTFCGSTAASGGELVVEVDLQFPTDAAAGAATTLSSLNVPIPSQSLEFQLNAPSRATTDGTVSAAETSFVVTPSHVRLLYSLPLFTTTASYDIFAGLSHLHVDASPAPDPLLPFVSASASPSPNAVNITVPSSNLTSTGNQPTQGPRPLSTAMMLLILLGGLVALLAIISGLGWSVMRWNQRRTGMVSVGSHDSGSSDDDPAAFSFTNPMARLRGQAPRQPDTAAEDGESAGPAGFVFTAEEPPPPGTVPDQGGLAKYEAALAAATALSTNCRSTVSKSVTGKQRPSFTPERIRRVNGHEQLSRTTTATATATATTASDPHRASVDP